MNRALEDRAQFLFSLCEPTLTQFLSSSCHFRGDSNTIQHSTVQHNATQHNAVQHNTTQYNAMQCNTTQRNTIQRNISLWPVMEWTLEANPFADVTPSVVRHYTTQQMVTLASHTNSHVPPLVKAFRKWENNSDWKHCSTVTRGHG